jgi:hypothetical protein
MMNTCLVNSRNKMRVSMFGVERARERTMGMKATEFTVVSSWVWRVGWMDVVSRGKTPELYFKMITLASSVKVD